MRWLPPYWWMRLSGATIDFQMTVKWLWLQTSPVGGEDGKREGRSVPTFKTEWSEVQILLLRSGRSYEERLFKEEGLKRWEVISSVSCRRFEPIWCRWHISESNESPAKSNWILDSDCSFHMCLIREHFHTCQSCEKGTINKANGTRGWVTGVETVRICMFDWVVQTGNWD